MADNGKLQHLGEVWDLIPNKRMEMNFFSYACSSTLIFYFYTLTETNQAVRCQLKVVAGQDDDGNPCLTMMMPDENY